MIYITSNQIFLFFLFFTDSREAAQHFIDLRPRRYQYGSPFQTPTVVDELELLDDEPIANLIPNPPIANQNVPIADPIPNPVGEQNDRNGPEPVDESIATVDTMSEIDRTFNQVHFTFHTFV